MSASPSGVPSVREASEEGSEQGPLVRVQGLCKRYRVGLRRRRVEAVRSVSFEVRRGECFGLLGPNGAGKTTTLKVLLGLVFPDGGTVELFGEPPGPRPFASLGYLPENPYIYPRIDPVEFLWLCGRLSRVPVSRLRGRIDEVLELVGLGHAARRPVRKLSKGMTQRLGLAQALLHEPELLILDEPMSGLDPIGRHEVRELLRGLRSEGVTLLITSHILSDVEQLCDRVAIVHEGVVRAEGPVADLLEQEARGVRVVWDGVSEGFPPLERAEGVQVVRHASGRLELLLEPGVDLEELLRAGIEAGARVRLVEPRRESLEARFLRVTRGRSV